MSDSVIVISAINIVDGGALSVLHSLLGSIIRLHSNTKIIVLAANESVVEKFQCGKIDYQYFPKSKKSWFLRVYYEYCYFWFLSRKINPRVWLSLHDMTPNVKSSIRLVYCHNPSPFFQMKISEVFYDWKQYLFTKFYKYLYKINIKKNDHVIVQQEWIADAFKGMFSCQNIVVARPRNKISTDSERLVSISWNGYQNLVKTFQSHTKLVFYPSYPRFFKNHEVIFKLAQNLNEANDSRYHFVVTIDGKENSFSKRLVDRYKGLPNVSFVGIIPREEVEFFYENADILVFPSRLETWGLPITEFKKYNKKIVLPNLPYAYETLGEYDRAVFFEPNSSEDLLKALNSTNYYKTEFGFEQKDFIHINNWDDFSLWLLGL